MFFDFLHPFAFLIALAIGIFYVYISTPPKRIVYKFPTPDNAGKIIYRDEAGTCYKYKAVTVPCSSQNLKKIQLQ